MKKRKTLSFLLVYILSFAILSGCSIFTNDSGDENEANNASDAVTLVAYNVGGSDSLIGVEDIGPEYVPWSKEKTNYFLDSTAAEKASVTFNGKKYTGEYYGTNVAIPNFYEKHNYKGDKFSFEINSVTGEICSFSLYEGITTEFNLSEEECRNIADVFAKNYIAIQDYEIEITPRIVGEKYCFYSVNYFKKVSGYKTNDGMSITVTGNGEIIYYGTNSLGAFDATSKIAIDRIEADKVANKKLKEMFKNFDDGTWTAEVEDIVFVKTDGGNQALLYTFEAEVSSPSDAGNELVDIRSGLIKILVELKPFQSN